METRQEPRVVRAEAPGSPWIGFLVAVLACFLVISLLSALAHVQQPGEMDATVLSIDHAVSDESLTVSVDIGTEVAEPVAARAWWLLAKPGDRRPWIAPAFRSGTQELVLARGVTTIEWEEPLAIPGTYELSVWVHTSQASARSAQSYAHAATGRGDTLVTVEPGVLGRQQPPTGALSILGVVAPTEADDNGSLRIRLRNHLRANRETLIDLAWSPARAFEDVDYRHTASVLVGPGVDTVTVALPKASSDADALWLRLRDARTLAFLDAVVDASTWPGQP